MFCVTNITVPVRRICLVVAFAFCECLLFTPNYSTIHCTNTCPVVAKFIGFHSGKHEVSVLLRHEAALLGTRFLNFRQNLVVSKSPEIYNF